MTELQKAPWSDWETVRLIGRGSFGTVYEIQRKLVDEDTESAALKVITIPQNPGDVEEMYSEGYDDESITATFNSHLKSIVTEYSLMQKMEGSANIVNCKDIRYIQHDDGIGWDIYIRMELLTPLMKALPVDVDEATVIRIGKDICNALVLCKKHEIIHRDIKPQNIFVSPNGDYKLGDFGIAKTVEKTMGGTKVGTYKYMAPEVYHNQPYGSAADIYSLGLVLYWMLNERRMPFMPLPPAKMAAGQDEQARHRRLSGEAIPAPAHGSDALKKIVLKACAYDPKDRYSSAAQMLAELGEISGDFTNESAFRYESDQIESDQADKTVGPVFDKQKKKDADAEDDATVGPDFKRNAESEWKQKEEVPETSHDTRPQLLKYILIGALILAVILLILLVRSCGAAESSVMQSGHATDADSVTQAAPFTEETDSSTQMKDWSDWVDQLPSNVSAEKYEIQEKTLYSSRTLETTSSNQQSDMAGWELYDTIEENGGYGPWSSWSEAKMDATADREVESKMMYRFRDKETTTETFSNKDGWILYDTSYSPGEYGTWSGWSTDVAYSNENRAVESKTQYRYRNISYSTEYTGWSSWGSWSFDRQGTSDLKKEQSRQVWGYYYFTCPNCGAHMHGWGITCPTWAGGCGKGWITEGMWTQVYSTTSWDAAGLKDWHGTGKYWTTINGERVFKWTSGGSGTQYRYATRSTQQVTSYGNWSNWEDTPYYSSSSREVQKRTVYRYCDRTAVAIYHFYRWGAWSDWSENAVSGNNDRQVEYITHYRYRDQVKNKTYLFRRWTQWSDYSETPVTASETTEVQTKNQYRYKEK